MPAPRLSLTQKIETAREMRAEVVRLKRAGETIALVPTMGALHVGHAALIARAKELADTAVVSIFVNPLALGANENFAGYPRTPDADLKLCAELKVDAVFAPAVEEMFPRGYSTFVSEEAVSKPLCGVSRPTHFRGVATGLVKLLNIVQPDFIVLSQREAQQIAVVRKILADLAYAVEVAVVPIVREPDGLAVGVRTRNFTASQRQEAQVVYRALERAKAMVDEGVRSTDRVIAEVTHLLGQRLRIRTIYVAIVDPSTMEAMREIVPGRCLLAIAAWIDEVRLIDNVAL